MNDMGESPTSGVFGQAWELVKQKPGETLLLSFLTLMFNSGGSGFSMPSGGGGGGSEQPDSWDSTYDTAGALPDVLQNVMGSIGTMELAVIGGIIAVALIIGTIAFVIGTVIRGGATIYWLRLIRGQSAELTHSFAVTRFFAPLLIATIVAGIVSMLGYVLLIIPGVIITMGLYFVTQVVVDKDIGYVDALKYSWDITHGHKLDLFIFTILAFFLNMAGLLACCVGVVVTNAVVMGASTIIYTRLTAPGNAYLDADERTPATGETW